MKRAVGIAAIALALLGAGNASALTLEPVGSGFDQPIYVTSDPANPDRLFVVEREGTIQLVEEGTVSQFTDLSAEVGCAGSCEGERGLLSIALSPDFDASGRLFVAYANDVDGDIQVEELVSADPGHETADPSTLKPLLSIPHPVKANHNGGQLQFGPDGYLYLSTGDGGGANDEFHNAQDPTSQLGKIVRLDPDGVVAAEIWSSGLRNPYRFSFDSLSGDMVIGDVGQSAREEIDFAPSPFPGIVGGAGANYGWNCREGLLPGPATDPQCTTPPAAGFVPPVFEYSHAPDPDLGGSRCAVTGGYVVRDPGLGGLYGSYLYADYCAGALRALQLPRAADGSAYGDCSLGLRASKPVSFGEDAAGRLYVVEEGGRVLRLEGLPPASCPAPLAPAQSLPVPVPLSPTFVGLKAERRRVERGKAALLTVFVSPCERRRGTSVALLRNGRLNGSKFLSRACTARFAPRVRSGTRFVAVAREQHGYLPGKSRQLTIRLAHHRRHSGSR